MSGGARASTRLPTAAVSTPPGSILPPLRRHLAFASMKPPFVHPDDYNGFAPPAKNTVADDDVGGIMPQKWKSGSDENRVESSEWASSTGLAGFSEVSGSPFHTPVSAKGGRTCNRSKSSKILPLLLHQLAAVVMTVP